MKTTDITYKMKESVEEIVKILEEVAKFTSAPDAGMLKTLAEVYQCGGINNANKLIKLEPSYFEDVSTILETFLHNNINSPYFDDTWQYWRNLQKKLS